MQVQPTDNQSFAYASPSSSARLKSTAVSEKTGSPEEQNEVQGEESDKRSKKSSPIQAELNLQEQQQLQDLKVRDRQVRAHEAAHLAASGPYAKGGASYSYQKGPDGRQYAVGGEVSIDTAPVANDPAATIRKARTVRRAANAPSNPSAQDRRVASQASSMEAEARKALVTLKAEENKPTEKKTVGMSETSKPKDLSAPTKIDESKTENKRAQSIKSPQEQSLINPLDYVGGLLDLVA